MSDETVEVYAEMIVETMDAYLIEPPDSERVWLPKSQCEYDGKCTFTVALWLAEQRDLV